MIIDAKPIKSKTANGFTLIETVVSLGIIAVTLVSLIAIFPTGLKIGKSSADLTTAVYLAQAGMESALSRSYDDLGIGVIEPKNRLSSDESVFLYNFWRQTSVDYLDENFNIAVTDTGLKKINVTVYWTDRFSGNEKEYILYNLKADN